MSKTEIKSIVIQLPDGKTMEMSLDDARALYGQLDELFGDVRGQPVSYPVYINEPHSPNFPIWIDDNTSTPRKTDFPTIWCVEDKDPNSPSGWTADNAAWCESAKD